MHAIKIWQKSNLVSSYTAMDKAACYRKASLYWKPLSYKNTTKKYSY